MEFTIQKYLEANVAECRDVLSKFREDYLLKRSCTDYDSIELEKSKGAMYLINKLQELSEQEDEYMKNLQEAIDELNCYNQN